MKPHAGFKEKHKSSKILIKKNNLSSIFNFIIYKLSLNNFRISKEINL